MSDKLSRRRSLESLKKEAKRWFDALRRNIPDARTRFERAVPDAPAKPTLRDVQHALARGARILRLDGAQAQADRGRRRDHKGAGAVRGHGRSAPRGVSHGDPRGDGTALGAHLAPPQPPGDADLCAARPRPAGRRRQSGRRHHPRRRALSRRAGTRIRALGRSCEVLYEHAGAAVAHHDEADSAPRRRDGRRRVAVVAFARLECGRCPPEGRRCHRHRRRGAR